MRISEAERVQAMREGGWTQRVHTVPKHGSYSVAEHSWNVMNLAFLLFPQDRSLNLVMACAWHDVPERWVGDSPHPAKYPLTNGNLAAVLKEAEKRVEKMFGIGIGLSKREAQILKLCDMLELLLWSVEQSRMGNNLTRGIMLDAHKTLKNMSLWGEVKDCVGEILRLPASTERCGWWGRLMRNEDVQR